MGEFSFDEHTRLIELVEAYPWLCDALPAMDSRLAVMNTPVGRMLMRSNTVGDFARLSGLSAEKLLARLRREIERYESAT